MVKPFIVKAASVNKTKKTKTSKETEYDIFRGVKDVWPSQVSHRYEGDGIFGKGTYYALSENVAEEYANGGIGLTPYSRFALIFGYKVRAKNPLKLTPDIVQGLTSGSTSLRFKDGSAEQFGFPSSMSREQLSSAARESGYDCIVFTSEDGMYNGIDGEEQMLIPKGSLLQPKVVWMDVLFNDEDDDLAEEIAEALGGDISSDSNNLKVTGIPLSKIKALTKMLERTSSDAEADDD